eukprot:jgi/Picre1/29661/NNA_005044.t1
MKKGSAPTAIVINAVPGVGGPSFGSGASTMRGHGIILKLALYVCIFIGLIVAVRYTGSLEQGTVRSLHEVASSDISPTSFNEPPKAAYEKIALDELEFKTSSFKCTDDEEVNQVSKYCSSNHARVVKIAVESSTTKKKINVAYYEHSMFQRVRSLTNWYWAMNSISNTFHRLCLQLGACTQAKVHEVALLQPATYSPTQRERKNAHIAIRTGQHSSASDELKGCLGPMFWVDHPRMHDSREWVGDEMVIMEETYFGIGKSVIQPNVALEIDGSFAFEQSDTKTGQKRIEFLRKCASLPPVPPEQENPSIVLINRPFGDGRSIIGLDDVYDRLQRVLPPNVELTLHFPRGGSGLNDRHQHLQKPLFW